MYIETVNEEEFFVGELLRLKKDNNGRGQVKECGCPEACTAIYDLMSRKEVEAKITIFDSITHMSTDKKSLNISLDIKVSDKGFEEIKGAIKKFIDDKLQELNEYGYQES